MTANCVMVIIIKASFHLTYLITEGRCGTADEFATSRLQLSLSFACVLNITVILLSFHVFPIYKCQLKLSRLLVDDTIYGLVAEHSYNI